MARVLLVDDDDHQRLLYRTWLTDDGHSVVEAEDGAEALASIERSAPDLVVLDVNMAGMDGLETLTRIHDRHRGLPIVLNTAYAAYRERFVSWLADAYVTKSSSPDELREAVRTVLARHGKS